MLSKLLLYLIANAAMLIILAAIFPNRVSYTSYLTVAIFAVVLMLLNFSVRPLLHLITSPLSCLTLGLFGLVVNGIVIYVGAKVVSGVQMTFLAALVGAIIAGILNGGLSRAFERDRL